MKDKRQRMAMAWPYAMYTDPAIAAGLIAAATVAMGPSPYHTSPVPNGHLGVPSSYQTAAAAYYAARYSPYGVGGGNGSSLHRPHPQSPAYPPHPHLMQPHHPLPPLHLPMPNVNNFVGTPTSQPLNIRPGVDYRPAHLPELSPAHSDASSDCDCAGSIHHHHGHHLQGHDKASPPLKMPAGLNLLGLPSQIQSIQSAFESKHGGYHHGVIGATTVPTSKIEPPKLFQPYKSDITEKA